jgi:hypothetical protein
MLWLNKPDCLRDFLPQNFLPTVDIRLFIFMNSWKEIHIKELQFTIPSSLDLEQQLFQYGPSLVRHIDKFHYVISKLYLTKFMDKRFSSTSTGVLSFENASSYDSGTSFNTYSVLTSTPLFPFPKAGSSSYVSHRRTYEFTSSQEAATLTYRHSAADDAIVKTHRPLGEFWDCLLCEDPFPVFGSCDAHHRRLTVMLISHTLFAKDSEGF